MPSFLEYNAFPAWMNDAPTHAVGRARALAAGPYTPYLGQLSSLSTPDLLEARRLLRQHVGATGPQFQAYEQRLADIGRPISAEDIRRYQNPYIQDVIDRMAREGGRTYREHIMPQIEAKFVRHGQHGSRQHRAEMERFGREITGDITERQQSAMAKSFHEAQEMARHERGRQAALAAESARMLPLQQALRMSEVGALEHMGTQQQAAEQAAMDRQYQQYLRQSSYPYEQVAFLSNVLQGIPHSGGVASYQPAPPPVVQAPQMGAAGQIGQLSGQLLGAHMMGGRG